MKVTNQLRISPLREGANALKVLPSYKLGKTWTRPVSVNFLITSRCNSKCVTCDSWKLTDHDNELSTDEFRRLAEEIEALGIPIVTIGGGEPLLRSDLWEIIRAFKDRGRVVQLTTNAVTLREVQRKKLYESGLDRVTVSVDSHIPEIYEKIRGLNAYSVVEGNVKLLLEERPPHLEVDTNTVLCADNSPTFLQTIDHLIDLGISSVNFSAVTTAGANYLMTEAKTSLADIEPKVISNIIDGLLQRKKATGKIAASTAFIKGLQRYYANPYRVVFPCFAGYLTIDIFQDGSIHGCGNLPAIANVREGSLSDLWYGDRASKNRQNMAEGKCPNCYLSCKMELAIASNPRHLPLFAIEKLRIFSE